MNKFILSTFIALGLLGSAEAAENPLIGVVNFASCVTDSKSGKKEQENLEGIRKQMANLIEDTDRELREMAAKFDDPEYLDSLSPKAEEEMKTKFQARQEDLTRYQNQFYQVMNQMQMQMLHKINANIAKAAEAVAREQCLDYVMNKEACFYIRSDLDMTAQVITEMDKLFDLEAKKLSENSELNTLESNLFDQIEN